LGHFSAITGSGCRNLEEGQKVQYEASQGFRGLQATGGRSPGTSCSDIDAPLAGRIRGG
jgi:hypothetical protein